MSFNPRETFFQSLSQKQYPDYFDNVILFLKFNGTTGASVFTDSSFQNTTFTANRGARISSTFSKSEPTSLHVPNTGDDGFNSVIGTKDLIWAAESDLWHLGTQSFTIEAWINMASGRNGGGWMGQAQRNDTFWAVSCSLSGGNFSQSIGAIDSGVWRINLTQNISAATASIIGVWNHIAITRQSFATGSTWFFFFNGKYSGAGVQSAGGTNNGNFANITGTFSVGSSLRNLGVSFQGYLDDVIITKGVAKYVGDFEPVYYNY